jgi:hypothetical protein
MYPLPFWLYSLPENVTEPDVLLVKITEQVPGLVPALLFMIWAIITIGGYFTQERRIGTGHFPMWFTIGGLITTTISFILYLIPGLLNLEMVIILIAVTFGSAMWYFLASRSDL